jgi:hypothetical protein
MKAYARVSTVVCILVLLSGCGLSRDLTERATKVQTSLTSLEQVLEKSEKEFHTIATKDAALWSFLQPYAEREKWGEKFTEVKGDLSGLRQKFDSEIAPLVKADKPESSGALMHLLGGTEKNFAPITARIQWVSKRIALLQTSREKAGTWIQESRTRVSELDVMIEKLAPAIEDAKESFSNRSDAIDVRFAPLKKVVDDAHHALDEAEKEFAAHVSNGVVDYAVFADGVKAIEVARASFDKIESKYRSDLGSLYKDHIVVLRDMKIEYRAQIGRTSWSESAEWDNDQDHLFQPTFIPKEAYEYLGKLSSGEGQGEQGNLARYSSGWGSWNSDVHIRRDVWDRLKVKMDEAFPSSDDSSTFWLAELEPVYYHKYAHVAGKTVMEGTWEEVDEAEYGEHANDFGMAIETKPLGKFTDEVIEEPTPVGIEMVGNTHYGAWREDHSGNSFWEFYGQYAFMNALLGSNNHYYSRDEYNAYRTWRRDKDRESSGWYGTSGAGPTYGSSGSQTQSTTSYKGSPFAKSGGVRSVSPSVRNAGMQSRSRGPGAGGK